MMRLLFLVLMAVAYPLPAHAAAIRDVRPTTIESGDTLIVECPGLRPGSPAVLRFSGPEFPEIEIFGHGAAGDRALFVLPERAPVRVTVSSLEVRQPGIAETWRWPSALPLTLNLFPSSLQRLVTRIDSDAPAGPGMGGALSRLGQQLPAGLLPIRPLLPFVLVLLIGLVIHSLVAPITGLLVVWERKIAGRMHSRLGPNRVGPSGWLQWLADALKMLTKEDLTPSDADAGLYRLAPYLMWMSVFATFVVLPLSQTAIVADLNIGVLYVLSVTSLTAVSALLGGWASNSKWSLLGGMRAAAQIVSYELPASLALLQIPLLAGTLSPQEIIRAQGGLPHQWFLFSSPFAFLAFWVYFIAALAEGNRAPFDLPEAESELVAGYMTEYSGFRFGIFSLAEWTNLYVLGALASALFLGGWSLPFVTPEVVAASLPLTILSVAVMVLKIVSLVFVIIWIRWTLPRLRVDQLMRLCWQYLTPVALFAFVGTAALLWAQHSLPWLGTVSRWATFLFGGVAVLLLFAVRVRHNFRATRMLYAGKRQFIWPVGDPPAAPGAPS